MIEFQVPDSVTSWNVWVHAITRDLKSGSLHRETQSVKDLMVRPYVPRFLREGDSAELKVVVNNASAGAMSGTVALDILDTETNTSALAAFGLTPEKAAVAFSAAAGGSANATFAILAPEARRLLRDQGDGRRPATSRTASCGPCRCCPGRMQLAQSRFVALCRRRAPHADVRRHGEDGRRRAASTSSSSSRSTRSSSTPC